MHNFDYIPFGQRLKEVPAKGGLVLPGWWVWCGSVLRGPDGKYNMFASRWPQELPMWSGCVCRSEIARAVSDTPEGPFEFAGVALGARGGQFWDGRMTHNPAAFTHEGRYYLSYVATTYHGPTPGREELLEQRSDMVLGVYSRLRIGIAVADDPAGPWTRSDEPVLVPDKDGWDNTVVTNPAPCITPEGRVRLYYRSNTPAGCRLGVAEAERIGATFQRLTDRPILPDYELEDPYVWWQNDHYEMICKDLDGRATGEYHAMLHAVSADGIDWQPADPARAVSRTVSYDDGRTVTLGSLEKPGLLLENGSPACLYAATADGPGGFDAAVNTWNTAIPLKQ